MRERERVRDIERDREFGRQLVEEQGFNHWRLFKMSLSSFSFDYLLNIRYEILEFIRAFDLKIQ